MQWLFKYCRSSIGSKVLMAVTGLMLFGFVVGHMLGNLQIFIGQEAVNNYAATLKEMGALLWLARIGLILAVLVHISAAIRLTRGNQKARPITYAHSGTVQATYASRTMMKSGLIVLAFVIYHLLHLTFGVILPEAHSATDSLGRPDVYSMTVLGFQNVLVSLSYIAAMLLLGFHLSHGVSSLFQSLGLNHPRYNPIIQKIGPSAALVIVLGNISMPIAVLLGLVSLPAGAAS